MSASVRRSISCSGLMPHTLAPGCVSPSKAVGGMQWTPLPEPGQAEDYPHTSGPWGQAQDHARICTRCPLPVSILWCYPVSSYTSASTATSELERHLLFLFDTYSYHPQNVSSPFYCCSSSQLILLRAFLGKCADHASMLWISLLPLWFNTNIIFCDQISDASVSPKAWFYPSKPRHTNFTKVKRQCKGE